MNRYETSACIGFWRMGVDEATISAILNCYTSDVFRAIKVYESTLK